MYQKKIYPIKLVTAVVTFLLFITTDVFAQNANSRSGDELALREFYENTSGWSNNTGWSNPDLDNPPYGVEVAMRDGELRVVRINVSENGMSGQLPESIGNWSKLEYINLKQNSLTGEIPETIGNWAEIEWLMLSGRYADDPPLSNPQSGYHVGKSDESGNTFSGEFPDVWSSFSKLLVVEISGSQITSMLYDSMGNNTELRIILINYNPNLNDSIPASWNNLTKLNKIYIAHNNLQGVMPDITGMTDLRQFWAMDNNLTGPMPDFRNSTLIREIDFDKNNLSGDWPHYWNNGDFTNLISLRVSWNDFTGTLHGFENLDLRVFAIDGSNLTGSIPESITTNTKLINLSLGWNNFTGQIPQSGWGNHGRTRYIRFANNNLEGPIPDELPNSPDLKYLYFENNNLSGSISTSHGKYANSGDYPVYEYMSIGSNKFHEEEYQPLLNELGSSRLRVGSQDPEGEPDDGSGGDDPTAPSTPSLQSPSSNATGVSVTPAFSWSSVSADSYTLRVYTSSGSLVFENTGSGTGYSTPSSRTLDYDTEYSWRVRATRDGLNSDWSSSRSFTTESDDVPEPTAPAVPSLQSPSNGASTVSVNPDFSWSSVNAESYTLQVYNSGGSLVFENTGSGTNYSTPSSRTLDHDTEYSWRVRATRDGLNSDWSSSRSFRTEVSDGSGGDDGGSGGSGGGDNDPLTSPDLTSPKDGETDVSPTPTLQWESLDADYYILHLDTPTTETLVIDTEVNGTSYSVKNNESLNPETLYKWRVRGVKDGVEGEWSTIAEFTTQSENGSNGNNGKGPQKATPAKDEKKVKNNATFTWESVDGAESYTIEIRESATSSLFVGEEVTDTVYVSSQRMKGNTEYTWRVRATIEGQSGDWSDEWEFTTEDENEETVFVVELDQNYPNPFNPSTNIRFTLSEQQEVSLKVYDMAGRLVASLVDGNTLSAGTHSASFNAGSLASGIYFYRLITPGEIVTRKMTLMK